MSEYWRLENVTQEITYLNTVDGLFINSGLAELLDVYTDDYLWEQQERYEFQFQKLVDDGIVTPMKELDFTKIIDYLRREINRRIRELRPNYGGDYDTEGFYFIDGIDDEMPSDEEIGDLRALYIAFLEMKYDMKPGDICLVISEG